MRLQRVWIGEFRNLRDVVLDFEARRRGLYGGVAVSFLVGTNGSGKSNALDAIGMIFSHLDVGLVPGFAFDLEYEIRDQRVRVATPSRVELDGVRPVAGLDVALMIRPSAPAREWRLEDLRSDHAAIRDVLPLRVFGQSSGHTSTLGAALERSVEHLLTEREGGADPRLAAEDREIQRTTRRVLLDDRSIVFLNSSDAVLAALAVLARAADPEDEDRGRATTEILARIGLMNETALVAFSARLVDGWEGLGGHESQQRLQRLVARAAVTTPLTDRADEPGATGYRIAFDAAVVAEELNSHSVTPLRFFDDLVAWQRSGALTDVHLVLRKSGVAGALTHRDLSDGEYAYLTRYALMRLALGVSDSLLLFDEVENHFNAVWCMDLVHNLVALGGGRASSELVLATHSDVVLTDADPAAVVHFAPAADDPLAMTTYVAPIPTLAASREAIASRFFGVTGGVGRFGLDLASEALKLDKDAIDQLLPIVGPGLPRFRLERRRYELEDQ